MPSRCKPGSKSFCLRGFIHTCFSFLLKPEFFLLVCLAKAASLSPDAFVEVADCHVVCYNRDGYRSWQTKDGSTIPHGRPHLASASRRDWGVPCRLDANTSFASLPRAPLYTSTAKGSVHPRRLHARIISASSFGLGQPSSHQLLGQSDNSIPCHHQDLPCKRRAECNGSRDKTMNKQLFGSWSS